MYFTINMALVTYFDTLMDSSDTPILQNWATHKQILPISLQTLVFNSSLLQVLKTLKDFVNRYKHKKRNFHFVKWAF